MPSRLLGRHPCMKELEERNFISSDVHTNRHIKLAEWDDNEQGRGNGPLRILDWTEQKFPRWDRRQLARIQWLGRHQLEEDLDLWLSCSGKCNIVEKNEDIVDSDSELAWSHLRCCKLNPVSSESSGQLGADGRQTRQIRNNTSWIPWNW